MVQWFNGSSTRTNLALKLSVTTTISLHLKVRNHIGKCAWHLQGTSSKDFGYPPSELLNSNLKGTRW